MIHSQPKTKTEWLAVRIRPLGFIFKMKKETNKSLKWTISGVKLSIIAIALALALQAALIVLDWIKDPIWNKALSGVIFLYCIIAATFLIGDAIRIKIPKNKV